MGFFSLSQDSWSVPYPSEYPHGSYVAGLHGVGQDYWAKPYPNQYPHGDYVAGLRDGPVVPKVAKNYDIDLLRRRLGLSSSGLGDFGKPSKLTKYGRKFLAFTTPAALFSKSIKAEFKKTLVGGECNRPASATPEQLKAFEDCRAKRKKRTKQTAAAAAVVAAVVATVVTGGMASPLLTGPLNALKAAGGAIKDLPGKLGQAKDLVDKIAPGASDQIKDKLANELLANALKDTVKEVSQEEGLPVPKELQDKSDLTQYIPYAIGGVAVLGLLYLALRKKG